MARYVFVRTRASSLRTNTPCSTKLRLPSFNSQQVAHREKSSKQESLLKASTSQPFPYMMMDTLAKTNKYFRCVPCRTSRSLHPKAAWQERGCFLPQIYFKSTRRLINGDPISIFRLVLIVGKPHTPTTLKFKFKPPKIHSETFSC